MADADILARTIYGEARGELYGGRVAVANVVMNRLLSGKTWWGVTIPGVCKAKYQFSCWLESDPNRRVIEAVTEDDEDFAECIEIAREAAAGSLPDLTFGSCHYCVASLNPGWAKGNTPVIRIGGHKFFNDVE